MLVRLALCFKKRLIWSKIKISNLKCTLRCNLSTYLYCLYQYYYYHYKSLKLFLMIPMQNAMHILFVQRLCFSIYFSLLFRHLFNSLLNWIIFNLQYIISFFSLLLLLLLYLYDYRKNVLFDHNEIELHSIVRFFNVHNIFFCFFFFAFICLDFNVLLLFIYCKNQMVGCVRSFYLLLSVCVFVKMAIESGNDAFHRLRFDASSS